MRKFLFIIALFPLFGCGQSVQQVSYAQTLEIPDDAHPAPIYFKGIEIRLPPGTEIGTESTSSGLCMFPAQPLSRSAISDAIETKYLRQTFRETLEAAGYDVAGSPDKSYDPDDDIQRAEYSIKAKITDVDLDLCTGTAGSYSILKRNDGSKGELRLTVDWTIYDPLHRKIVLKTKTEGYTDRSIPNIDGLTLMFQDAFEMATHNLGADQSFYNLLVLGQHPEKGQAGYPYGTPAENDGEDRPHKFDPLEQVVIPKRPLFSLPFTKHSNEILETSVVIQKFGHGSGFFITDQGHILTNAHVVGDALRMRVLTHDGQALTAEVLRIDRARDVALLKLEEIPAELTITTLPIRAEIPSIGEDVFAVGSPKDFRPGLRDTVSKGIVSAYRKDMRVNGLKENFIQADVDIHAGNSGGMLLDGYGNIIGLSVMGISSNDYSTGLNYFIPVGEALERLGITPVI